MNKLYINRIITFLLAGVIIFQLYKNNKIEQANKGKNISSLEFYSMKEKKEYFDERDPEKKARIKPFIYGQPGAHLVDSKIKSSIFTLNLGSSQKRI